MNHTMEHNFRTKSLAIIGPSCSQKSGKFIQKDSGSSLMVPTCGSQTPGTCRNASRSSAWPEARRP